MEPYASHECDILMSYIIGECSKEERALFEKHLSSCLSCQKEVRELQEVWAMLPSHLEDTEVPEDLKAEVMDSIFNKETTMPKKPKTKWKPASLLSSLAVAILLAALVFALWDNIRMREHIATLEEQVAATTEIMKVYSLASTEQEMKLAKGTVQLVKQGKNKRIVANVKGLSATKGTEVYQVWLLHNGQRRSAGTFRVDSLGNGTLIYTMKNPDLSFDNIGITLEPDAGGSQPRGKKVLGT